MSEKDILVNLIYKTISDTRAQLDQIDQNMDTLTMLLQHVLDVDSLASGPVTTNQKREAAPEAVVSNVVPALDAQAEADPEALMQSFTLDELSQYNGMNGMPAYVAVSGVVYDFTNNQTWGGGSHFGIRGGTDVTAEFNRCHAYPPILENLPVVGRLRI